MRTVLVNPPAIDGERYIREGRCMQSVDSWAAVWPPLTLAIMAAVARRHGPVDLFDCNVEDGYDLDRTVRRIQRFQPDVVVVNTSFPSIESDAASAAAIKEACPDAVIVGFGVFFTLLGETAMHKCPGFDIGIVGEPEITFGELLVNLEGDGTVSSVPGVISRADGALAAGPARGFLRDLDELPFAARDLLHNDRYRLPHNGRAFTLINVARGCPYKCSYCIAPAYYGHHLRRHSLEYVIEEMEVCQRDHKITEFLFWEEVFTLDRRFGTALCEEILRRKWDVSWATTTRADCVDEEFLRLMKRAGCHLLAFGVESGDQGILDNVKKGETVEEIRAGIELARKVGLKTMGHFIFGLPGETRETAAKTIDYGLGLGLDYMQCYAAVPYPGTSFGDMAREKGWITAGQWSEYDFGGRSILRTEWITPADVDWARREMFRRFYLRPSYIARQLGTLIRHPGQILQASRFLNWIKTRERVDGMEKTIGQA